MPKLTKRVVDQMRPDPGGEIFVWDSELRGFGVRMMSSGVASFILKYRTLEGRQRKLALGRVGTLTPEQARDIAREKLVEATKGADPSAERQKIRQSLTIAELCDAYLDAAKGRVKASTLAMDRSRIESHVKPLIGKRGLLSLTSDDVERMMNDIIAGKTAKKAPGRGGNTTGGKGAAGRTVGMLGTILQFAVKKKLIKDNVARGIERPAEGKQRRYLTLAEIKTLGQAMREAEEEGDNATATAAIRFLLLTGCRRMEALSLKVDCVDRGASCIRFEDTKVGPQIRAIGKPAFDAIEVVTARNGWAFPASRGKGHFVGLPKVLERMCKRAGLKGVTLHVLRHSFAATAAEMGFSELTIAGLLGHTVPGVTARYAHVPDRALVVAADQVARAIDEALTGKAQGKVVQMPRRA